MGNWIIVSVDATSKFYNDTYSYCSKIEAIRKFNYDYPQKILLNIIRL